MDAAKETIIQAVRNFRHKIDEQQGRRRAFEAGLVTPEPNTRRANEFVAVMNAETARLMSAIPEFTDPDWEVFIDLVGNIRHMLDMKEGGVTLR